MTVDIIMQSLILIMKENNADDLIWDKTFKITLNIKKTNRKIDLNITYTLNSE
jgi:hypothetical protein